VDVRFAFGCFGTGGLLGVRAIGGQLGFGNSGGFRGEFIRNEPVFGGLGHSGAAGGFEDFALGGATLGTIGHKNGYSLERLDLGRPDQKISRAPDCSAREGVWKKRENGWKRLIRKDLKNIENIFKSCDWNFGHFILGG
jgi:hypothetical protein